MTVTWAGLGPDLLLGLDRDSSEPLIAQLQRQVRDAIRTGRLAHGERLPSSRALAEQLGVSRGVVVECYSQLESEGYLTPRVGRGTQVAYQRPAAAPVERPAPDVLASPTRFDVDFEYGVPDVASFPMREWSRALGVAVRSATVTDLGDEHGPGNQRLREVIAAYLRRVRASSVDADSLVVCPGFRHGLNVVLRAMAGQRISVVALEDPGPMDHDTIVGRAGLRPVAVPVDDDGIDVDALEASGARAVIVTPAHQCPTGVVLSAGRRLALIEWARRVDGYIIEDDYDAEFRYDRQPVGSLQGLAPDRVIGMGSVSKTLAPMLRIGWIACPPELVDPVVEEKLLLGRGAPALDQLALAELVESGRFDTHLRHMRALYGRRRQALVDALAAHAPEAVLSGLAAGCHAVVQLPAGCDEEAVVRGCAERSVRVYTMNRYRAATMATDRPELVLGYGNVSEAAIDRGIAVLGEVLLGHQ